MWFSFGDSRNVQICFLALYIFTGNSLKHGESIIETLFWKLTNTYGGNVPLKQLYSNVIIFDLIELRCL